ncbi:LamG domain-containing protein, partial [archaeon]|nr:LamG domain-containing protein [archaeon]
MKGFSLITFVIVTALSVTGIALTLTFLLPEIDRAKASGVINDALQQLDIVDSIVREVATEGTGSQRTYNLRVRDGTYQVKNDTGSFEFEYTTQYSPLDQGVTAKRGNVLLSTTVTGAKAYESDEDSDGFSELVLENEALKATLKKYPFSYATWGIRDINSSYWLDSSGNSLTSGLVGYWKFGEGSGSTTNDSSGYNNHGTLTSMNTVGNATSGWTDGKYGKALRFDGVDDYVNVGNSSSLGVGLEETSMSVAFWFKPDTTDFVNGVISKQPSYGVEGMGSGGIRLLFTSTVPDVVRINSNPVVGTANTWYHVVFVKDGTAGKAYVNGADQTASSDVLDDVAPTTNNLIIGSWYTGSERFNGTIDEVRIYNRALSADEISQLYQAGRIRLANDFISVRADPYIQLNLTNSTNNDLFKLVTEEIKLNNTPITSIYYANPLNNSARIYYYDWENSRWLIWMNTTNNATHGKPDITKPIYKQAFKWMYSFNRTNFPDLNITYVLTASDPFIRQIIDVNATSTWNLEIPLTVNQTEKRMCLSANYTDGRLASWNERNCYEYGNPYTAYDAVWKMKSTADFNDTGLVGYWKLDEGYGQAVKDLSGYNNNGTLGAGAGSGTDDPVWFTNDSCKFGSCLSFDGSNDYVDVGNKASLDLTTALTITAWVKLNTITPAVQTITDKNYESDTKTGYSLRIADNTGLYLYMGNGTTIGTVSNGRVVTTGSWYHLAVTFSSGTATIYSNGVSLVNSTSDISAIATNTANLLIGSRDGNVHPFNGTIDEVRIYNKSLSADEILTHYQTQAVFYNSSYNIQSNEWNLT